MLFRSGLWLVLQKKEQQVLTAKSISTGQAPAEAAIVILLIRVFLICLVLTPRIYWDRIALVCRW